MATNYPINWEAAFEQISVRDHDASGLNQPHSEYSQQQQQQEKEEEKRGDEGKGSEKDDIHDTPSKPPRKKPRLTDGPVSTRQTRSMTTDSASSPVKTKEPDRSAKRSQKLARRRRSSTDAAASGDRTTEEFEVERIVDSFVDRKEGVHWYEVKWKGWPPSANTWEAKIHLHRCRRAIDDFEKASRQQGQKRQKRMRKH